MGKDFRIVVLISGNGSNLQSIIDHIRQKKIDGRIVAVISNKASAYGLERASKANIPTHVISQDSVESYNQVLRQTVSALNPDLIVLAGYMKILPANFVNQFEGKIINIHPSLLPRHKGLNTHQRAIDSGDQHHGATVHFVTAELDDGPIIIQKKVAIDKDDTADSLKKKILTEEHKIYPMAIQWIASNKISFHQLQPIHAT